MLRYIGQGSTIFGVPARDLTEAEVAQIEAMHGYTGLAKRLVELGLYELLPEKRKPVRGTEGGSD